MVRELNYTITGTPAISNNFILTRTNTNNNIVTNQDIDFSKPFKFNFQITAGYSYFSNYMMYSENTSFMLYTGSRRSLYICSGSSSNRLLTITTSTSNGMNGEVELTWDGTTLTGVYTPADGSDPVTVSRQQTTAPFENGKIIIGRYGTTATNDEPSYDLKKFVIEYTDGTSFKLINEFDATIYYKLDHIAETKRLIKNTIVSKGVPVDDSVSFRDYTKKIGLIGQEHFSSNFTFDPGRGLILENNKYAAMYHTNGSIRSNDNIIDMSNCQSLELNVHFMVTTMVAYRTIFYLYLPQRSGWSDDAQSLIAFGIENSIYNPVLFVGNGAWQIIDTLNWSITPWHEYKVKLVYNNSDGYTIYAQDITNGDTDFTQVYHNNNTVAPAASSDFTEAYFSLGTNTYHAPDYNNDWVYVLPGCNLKYVTQNGVEKSISFVQ